MTNWRPAKADMYEDVHTRWQYAHVNTEAPEEERLKLLWRASRDSARTPVQWSDAPNAGFTEAEKPWFYVNDNYREVNVAALEQDPDSLLNFYREAIRLRKRLPCVRHGHYREYDTQCETRYVYSRQWQGQKLLVVCAFSDQPQPFAPPEGFDLKAATLALSSHKGTDPETLLPYESRVYLWE